MVQLARIAVQRSGRRPKVAVVYEDVTTGYKCADWFALHGYQATLTSAVQYFEGNLKELGPDLIVVGFASAPMPLQNTVPRLQSTCPQVPIIAVVYQSTAGGNGSGPDLTKAFGADVFMCDSLDPPSSSPS